MIRQSTTGTNSSDVKLQNLSAILVTLLSNSGISRVQLAQMLGVSTATITNLISELAALGLVVEEGTIKTDRPQVGRPQKALRLVPEARYAVGVHIDVDSIHVMLGDLKAREIATHSFADSLDTPWETTLDTVVEAVNQLIAQHGVKRTDIVGIGVAASGLVDPYSGVNVVASHLEWQDVPIRDYLADRLELPIVVDNNVRAMALGEALFGCAQDVHALALIYARMGVGAGLVVGGELYRGAAAGAGEIGHTTLVVDGGEVCHCGNTGCLETLFSEPVIIRLARELVAEQPNGILAHHLNSGDGSLLRRIFEAARAGDKPTQRMLEDRARYMGIALANLINIVNPELIVLGGILHRGADLFLPTIGATLRQRAFAGLGEQVHLQTTSFGDDVGMVGATALALDQFLYRPYGRLGEHLLADQVSRLMA